MNFLRLTLFLIHVLVEIYFLHSSSKINPTSIGLFSVCLVAFMYNFSFRKYKGKTFLMFSLVFFSNAVAFNMIQTYYNGSVLFGDFTHFFLMVCFMLLVFLLFVSDLESYKEYKSSGYLPSIFRSLIAVSFVYSTYFHLKAFNYTDAVRIKSFSLDQLNLRDLISKNFINFGILFNDFVVINIIKHFHSKSKKKIFLQMLMKMILIHSLVYVAFILNYNSVALDFFYDLVYKYVPTPHNVILYNSFAIDPDLRYKLITMTIFYLIN